MQSIFRKITIVITCLIATVGVIIQSLAPNPYVIIVGLVITGFGIFPASAVDMVYLNEILNGHSRALAVVMMYVMWGLAEMLIYPLSLITSDWRYFTIYFIAIPMAVCNLNYFLLMETPKFLQSKDKKKTIDSINYMAKVNLGNQYVEYHTADLVDADCNFDESTDQKGSNNKKYSYFDLIKYRSVRYISIYTFIFSLGIHQIYYGLQFSLNDIGQSFVVNSLYTGLGDFLGYLVSEFVCAKFPRKKSIIITLNLTCIICRSLNTLSQIQQLQQNIKIYLCCIQYFFSVPESCKGSDESCYQKIMQICKSHLPQVYIRNIKLFLYFIYIFKNFYIFLASFARFVVSFSFSFLMIWSNELYPTTVRSSGLGVVFGLGLIGGYVNFKIYQKILYLKNSLQNILKITFVSPYLVSFSKQVIGLNPVIFLGLIGIACGIPAFFLKETLDKPLKDEIDEMTRKYSIRKKSERMSQFQYNGSLENERGQEVRKQSVNNKSTKKKESVYERERVLSTNQLRSQKKEYEEGLLSKENQ